MEQTRKPELLFATRNAGKVAEIRELIGDRFAVLSLDDVGVTAEIPETADTIEGNALIKVRLVRELTGKACFADDTGLELDALGGEPGVMSARYAGEDCDPERNIDKVLGKIDGLKIRGARFRTVIAFVDEAGAEHLFEGVCTGRIARHRQGRGGFGYDPIFIPDDGDGFMTFAQMDVERKNKISHRGKAVRALVDFLCRG